MNTEIQKTFETIQKQLENKSWTEQQDADFIEALTNVGFLLGDTVNSMLSLVDYFDQYVTAVHALPIFQTLAATSNDDVSPTQTVSAPDSAEPRTRRTPMDVMKGKK
jgi:hypothetical protein